MAMAASTPAEMLATRISRTKARREDGRTGPTLDSCDQIAAHSPCRPNSMAARRSADTASLGR